MVKVVAWTFTQNAYKHGRDGWLRQVVDALAEADEVLVFDHQSDDGSDELVAELGGVRWVHEDGNGTIGRAMNLGNQAAVDAAGPDGIAVTAADDILWRPGWREKVEAFWSEAPEDVGILCGLLEPYFGWAKPIERVEYGGVAGLSRPTVPSSAWTFRASLWDRMPPANEVAPSHDMPICHSLAGSGYRLVGVDLAENLGAFKSTWGNRSYEGAVPLDLVRWGLA
jgi:glycosyltransferase involved in cell wall biosynthesis